MSKKKSCENHECRKGKGFLALKINQELGEPKGTKEIQEPNGYKVNIPFL